MGSDNRLAYTDANANINAVRRYANPDGHPNAHADRYTDTDPDTPRCHADADAYAYANADADADSYSNSDTNTRTDS